MYIEKKFSGLVLDSDYHGSTELDFFIDRTATPKEQDWQAIKKKVGIK